jgi:hypothetical protein
MKAIGWVVVFWCVVLMGYNGYREVVAPSPVHAISTLVAAFVLGLFWGGRLAIWSLGGRR